jgi:hypothetical protein
MATSGSKTPGATPVVDDLSMTSLAIFSHDFTSSFHGGDAVMRFEP